MNVGPEGSDVTRRCVLRAAAVLLGGVPAWAEQRADVTLRIGRIRQEVAPGHSIATTGYNGSAPGPLIRLREGDPVTVDLFNDTDSAEYVHWHGLEIPTAIDGTEEEGSLAVPAGGHLRYRMTPRNAGSRYVHSHAMPMDDLTRGVYSGQFACVWVEPKRSSGAFDQEVFLATHEWEAYLSDTDLDDLAAPGDDLGASPETGSAEVAYGVRSINGKALGQGEPIRVKVGQRVCFHVVNASATENVHLSLPGHEFLVTALDGNPVPRARRVGFLELGASERVDAIVEMNNPGVWILGSMDADVRGSGLGVLIEYAGRRGVASYVEPTGHDWDYLLFGEDREVQRPEERVLLSIDRLPPVGGGMERWTINGRTFSERDAPQRLRKGARTRLVLENRTGDAHPIHLHRHTFELTRMNDKRTAGIQKDVVLVQGFQSVEVDFIPKDEGLALLHCHQQMHMDQGFKTLFRIN